MTKNGTQMQIRIITFLKFSELKNFIEDGIINKSYGPWNKGGLLFVQVYQNIVNSNGWK